MSYEPTQWQSGDVVTATKLNKLEQGVANSGGGGALNFGVLVVEITYDRDLSSYVLVSPEHFSDILNGCKSGKIPILHEPWSSEDEYEDKYYLPTTICSYDDDNDGIDGELHFRSVNTSYTSGFLIKGDDSVEIEYFSI